MILTELMTQSLTFAGMSFCPNYEFIILATLSDTHTYFTFIMF